MKKQRNFKNWIQQVRDMFSAPEIPNLSEEAKENCCQNCQSELISVSGTIEHIDYVTGDIYLTARCVTCGEPSLAHYSMVGCVNELQTTMKCVEEVQDMMAYEDGVLFG